MKQISVGKDEEFPTHVGVNRSHTRDTPATHGVPHARGGEPNASRKRVTAAIEFPTHVGVNRLAKMYPG